jgi:hypothetical protein
MYLFTLARSTVSEGYAVHSQASCLEITLFIVLHVSCGQLDVRLIDSTLLYFKAVCFFLYLYSTVYRVSLTTHEKYLILLIQSLQ